MEKLSKNEDINRINELENMIVII